MTRRDAYGESLSELEGKWKLWHASAPEFSSRGQRLDITEYPDWLRQNLDRSLELLDEAKRILREADWSRPSEHPDQPPITELIDVCDRSMALVSKMASLPPPLVTLAVHRQSVRAVKSVADSIVQFALLLGEQYYAEARRRMLEVQAQLDLAASRAHQVGTLVERAERVMWTPGFWALGDEYETGRVAWEGVDNQLSTVTAAADVVRTTFQEVPGIVSLADEHALLLLPAAAIGASLQDPERLIERAIAARRLLDSADSGTPGWVADPTVLLDRIWRGHRQLIDQVVRLGHAMRSNDPRRILLETALDVFSKFSEGPLRTLGGVVAIAADSAAGARLDTPTCDTYGPKKTIGALNASAPVLLDGMDALVRHAEAHYDYEITDDGVSINHLPPRGGGRLTDSFTDEDFFEQLINLNEFLVAIELALVPYLWAFPDDALQADLEQRSQNRSTRLEVLRALAGLKGWTDIEFRFDGPRLFVSGTYRGPLGTDSFEEILPMVAGAWAEFTEIEEVTLADDGRAVALHRSLFPTDSDSEPIRLHRTAALVTRVRRNTSVRSAAAWDLEEHVLPAVAITVHELRQALSSGGGVAGVQGYLAWMMPLLEHQAIDEPERELTERVIRELKATRGDIGAASVALQKNDHRFIARSERRLHERLARLSELLTELRARVDGSS